MNNRVDWEEVISEINEMLEGDLSKGKWGTCEWCEGEGHQHSPTFLVHLKRMHIVPLNVGGCCYDLVLDCDDAIEKDKS